MDSARLEYVIFLYSCLFLSFIIPEKPLKKEKIIKKTITEVSAVTSYSLTRVKVRERGQPVWTS